MEFLKCARCGAFYINNGYVCPKCMNKDNVELATFKDFIQNDDVELQSISDISISTGISEKNLKNS